MVTAVEQGRVDSVAFVVPSGVAWSLPVYELALMTAKRARDAGHQPELVVYTPERRPLDVFGPEASDEVAEVLDQAGIQLVRSVAAEVTPAGELVIPFEETPLSYERVIALPRLPVRASPGCRRTATASFRSTVTPRSSGPTTCTPPATERTSRSSRAESPPRKPTLPRR